MSNTNRYILWALAALLLFGMAWYGYWFVTNFERQTREVRSGISPEARKNRFLAAELFIRRSGQAVSSEHSRNIFALNPAAEDTIFLGHHSRLFLERNRKRLREWVEQGGTLILVAEIQDSEAPPPPLLDELGVQLLTPDDEEEQESPCDEESPSCETAGEEQPISEPPPEQETVEERWETVAFKSDLPGEYQARFLADRFLLDTQERAEVLLGTVERPKLLRYPLGNGSVTVLSDNQLFQNDAIAKLDHAYLLSLLIGEGKVWLFYSAEMPSLLQRLWKSAPHLTLLLALLLLLSGWRMLLRSGPRLFNQEEGRRNLLEHLDASARFSWRIDRAQQLLRDNRDNIEQAWRRRHPQLNQLTQQQRCEWIGKQSGVAARAVERTLYDELKSEQDFIRASSVLQRLAMAVKPGGGAGAEPRTMRDREEP